MPQDRGTALDGEIRQSPGAIFPEWAGQKAWRIVEGPLLADPVPRCGESPPQSAVAAVSGFWKGKRALAIARQLGGKLKNCTGEHCRARGYAVSTGGYELAAVKRYLRAQETEDQSGRV